MANRLFIYNAQPGDAVTSAAAFRLADKPSARYTATIINSLKTSLQVSATDKLYLVGHGGEMTLAAISPTELAREVCASPFASVGKITLVMCGSSVGMAANWFVDEMARNGYRGVVKAYEESIFVAAKGPLRGKKFSHEPDEEIADIVFAGKIVPASQMKRTVKPLT